MLRVSLPVAFSSVFICCSCLLRAFAALYCCSLSLLSMYLIGLIALLIALPLFGIVSAWFSLDVNGLQVLAEQMQTVMPGYLATSAWLAFAVTAGVIIVGAGTAVAISLFEFRGKRFL